MTVREILLEGTALLKSPCSSALIDTPALDAALLFAEVLHTGREDLIVRGNETLAERDRERFFSLLERRRAGECVAYILGRKEFRGLEFIVNPGVLVPRPDSETLLEAALEHIMPEQEGFSVLDLCTGSGALAVSLKKERPLLSVFASDISPEALETAALNAARLLGEAAVNLFHSDLFENINGRFNIIISNPPYVPSGELSSLAPEARREPRLALDGGGDGLELIRKIIGRAPAYLFPGGVLLLEAGSDQMPVIKILLEKHNYRHIKIQKDLAGRERVISAEIASKFSAR
jgi:release factor glutamine methyltransferase